MPNARRVQIGTVKGETPRKMTYFSKLDAPNAVESATPERQDQLPLKGALKFSAFDEDEDDSEPDPYGSPEVTSRPTTSRGKARPSPDDFFDYVVPSPEKQVWDKTSSRLTFEDASETETETETESDSNTGPTDAEMAYYRKLVNESRNRSTPDSSTESDSDSRSENSNTSSSDDSRMMAGVKNYYNVDYESTEPSESEPDTYTYTDDIQDRNEELTAIACWLFGSIMAT